MAIYDYRCNRCGERFEWFQRGAGDAEPSCPRCGDSHVTRLISLIAGLSSTGSSGAAARAPAGCGCGGVCACAN